MVRFPYQKICCRQNGDRNVSELKENEEVNDRQCRRRPFKVVRVTLGKCNEEESLWK